MYELMMLKNLENNSDCSRRKVGAVIVNEANDIIASGYNKIISYDDSCCNTGCKRAFCKKGEKLNECDAIHAEIMAISDLVYSNTKLSKNNLSRCKIYVSTFPCHECAKAIINLGIKTVIYLNDYPNMENDIQMFKDNDVMVIKMNIN